MDWLEKLAAFFLARTRFIVQRLPASFKQELETSLQRSNFKDNLNAEQFASLVAGLALTAAFLVLSITLVDLFFSFLYSFIVFCIVFLVLTRVPKSLEKQRSKLVNASLPASLRRAALELEAGVGFHDVLKDLANQNDIVGREFHKIVSKTGNGASVHSAFNDFARSTSSRLAARAAACFVNAHDSGTPDSFRALRELAREHASTRKLELREYNAKLALSCLLLIMVSAVLPAMTQAFLIIGSVFLDFGVTPSNALLLMTLGFPVASTTVVLLMEVKRP